VLAIGLGSLVSHLLVAHALPGLAPRVILFHMAWALLLPLPVLFVRLIKTAFLQWLVAAENLRLAKRSLTDASVARVLFYGAGMNLRSYITLCEANVTRNNEALLGILDDNLGLRGRIFRDLPILGPLEVLADDELLATLRPTKIVVTTPTICDQRLEDIKAFCREHCIALSHCVLTESEIAL
jgi:FlaA1/EpsC-like NDP-sugar epimerase